MSTRAFPPSRPELSRPGAAARRAAARVPRPAFASGGSPTARDSRTGRDGRAGKVWKEVVGMSGDCQGEIEGRWEDQMLDGWQNVGLEVLDVL